MLDAIACAIQIHIAAVHAQAGYNNDTPGLGILCTVAPNVRIAAGAYYNSVNRQSNYAAVAWQPVQWGPVRIGAMTGFVTGYGQSTVPMTAAVASLPVGKFEFHITAVPPAYDVSPAVAELSISFKF